MRKIIVVNHVTLDGVMQAPARADEDTRDGFQLGGWAIANSDPAMVEVMAKGQGAMLFGRRTYEDFYAVWPGRTDNPFTEVLDRNQKYVASTTLRKPLRWVNSTLLSGVAATAVGKPLRWVNSTLLSGVAATAVGELKRTSGPDLVTLGSGELIQSLMREQLIDEFILMIHPLVLGTGRRLFADGGAPATLQLADTTTTSTGVVIATYVNR